jgi:hypothetical protein
VSTGQRGTQGAGQAREEAYRERVSAANHEQLASDLRGSGSVLRDEKARKAKP